MKSNYRYKIVVSLFLFFTGLITLFQNCSNKNFTAQDSIDSSSLSEANSNIPMDCTVGSETVRENDSKIFYLSSSVPSGSTCQYENRVCTKGYFTGSYQYTSCSVSGPSSCLFNGATVAHGAAVTAFESSTSVYGQPCVQQQRTCANGALSGTYSYSSCTPSGPASCLFNGFNIPNGVIVTAFRTSTVPYGTTCVQQARGCNNGTLSGTYAYASCVVGAPASCLFNGMTIPHGASVNAFLYSSSGGFGGGGFGGGGFGLGSCNFYSQLRTCNNGTLSGTYPYLTCTN